MKIKFNSDDNLPLNKILKLHILTVIVRSDLKNVVNIIHKFFRLTLAWSIDARLW